MLILRRISKKQERECVDHKLAYNPFMIHNLIQGCTVHYGEQPIVSAFQLFMPCWKDKNH